MHAIAYFFLASSLALLLTACTPTPPAGAPSDHPLNDRIWLTAEQTFISPNELAARMAMASYVLVGEAHDNPRHHEIEAWAVRALAESGRRPALVAEMIAADQATALKIFFDQPRESAARLDFFLKWSESGWPDWRLYKPVFDRAVQFGFPLAAGNLDRTLMPNLHRNGFDALTAEDRTRLRLPEKIPDDVAAVLADGIIDGHCGHLPGDLVEPFTEVQYARDASLAQAMAAAQQTDGALLIAGAEHVRQDVAAPRHLTAHFGVPRQKIFTIALLETQAGRPAPADYGADYPAGALPFSAVWFTAGAPRGDPCAALQKKFK